MIYDRSEFSLRKQSLAWNASHLVEESAEDAHRHG
jgi:hypothetical protein